MINKDIFDSEAAKDSKRRTQENWPEVKRKAKENNWPDDEVIIEERSIKDTPKKKDLKLSGLLNSMELNFE